MLGKVDVVSLAHKLQLSVVRICDLEVLTLAVCCKCKHYAIECDLVDSAELQIQTCIIDNT